MSKMTGGGLVVRSLRAADVEMVFGLHGAHIDTIFQAALDQRLPIVDTRHEVSAGHAAEGYARVSQGLGVAVVTAAGGFTNVLTSIANASFDRTPVLYITGSGALRDDETNTLQAGFDQVAMAKPVAKWAHRITVTGNIPRLLAQAIRIARTSPRGPVLIDIPWDVLQAEVEADETPVHAALPAELAAAPSAQAVAQTLDRLAKAERPVIVAGAELMRAAAGAPLRALAERTGIPVFADYEALGLLSGCKASGGLIQGLYTFDDASGRPDLALMLGMKWGLLTCHGTGLLIPNDAAVIQYDSDAREIGRLRPVDLGVVCDPGEGVRALAVAAGERPWPDFGGWRETALSTIETRLRKVKESAGQGAPMHPYRATLAVTEALGPGAVVCADGALTYLWLTEAIATAQPRAFLCHGTFGSMGVGMGVSVGAQAAARGGRVALITGDGAVGYALGEFDTMVRHGLPVVVIVMNNRSWGATLHFQEIVCGQDRVTHTRLENGAYHEVAVALGGRGQLITRAEEIGPALQDAFASGRPTCLNLMVALDPIPPEELILMGRAPF